MTGRAWTPRSTPRLTAAWLLALGATAVLVYSGLNDLGPVPVTGAASALLAAFVLLARGQRTTTTAANNGDTPSAASPRTRLLAELERRLATPDASPTLLLLFDLFGFKAYNDDFGRETGDVLLERMRTKLLAVAGSHGTAFRLLGDEFCLLAPVAEGEGEALIQEAIDALSAHGDGFEIGCSFGGVLVPFEASSPEAALELGERRLVSQRQSRKRVGTMSALMDALAPNRGATAVTGRVESLALAVGGLLGLTGNRLQTLARAVEVYDLGELAIPREVLDKPGPLQEGEWELVRQQTLVAERVIRRSPQLWGLAPIVRATFENWDGTGYPDGLAGEDIPQEARIIRVCDAFDAMTSERAYRPVLSPEEALAQIESLAGTSFDPAVVKVVAMLVGAAGTQRRAA